MIFGSESKKPQYNIFFQELKIVSKKGKKSMIALLIESAKYSFLNGAKFKEYIEYGIYKQSIEEKNSYISRKTADNFLK